MASAGQKAALTRRIEELEKVYTRWGTYAPDEFLQAKRHELHEKIVALKTERAAMDGEPTERAAEMLEEAQRGA